MADVKISALPPATTPLTGSEVLPIVQSGTTDKVSVANLTAGRAVNTGDLTADGNVAITGTARRITGDFSNATISNRVAFQTTTANTTTSVAAIPSGTGTSASWDAYSAADPGNASLGRMQIVGGTDFRVVSTSTGTGTALPMTFYTGGSERMRIDASGNFYVGRTAISGFPNEAGIWVSPTQGITIGKSQITNVGSCIYMNRLASVGDGNLIDFAESGTIEGNISVSGTTVSYNGGHLSRWSQLPTLQRDPELLKGTVLSNLDEMCEWLDAEGNPLPNEQLNRMKISDVEGDPNVAGVFVNWDNDDQANPYDMNIAMTGDMIIRIAAGVVVQKGDLLMSAGDGTAKPQGDDIRRSKTVAKVTSNHVTCTYDDGSYCVPCVLMAC